MRQTYSEESVSLLVAVLELLRLEHQHGIWHVVEDLGEAVSRLFGLHLHDEELGDHASRRVGRDQHEHRPLRYEDQWPPVFIKQNIYDSSFQRKYQRSRAKQSKEAVEKWCQENARADVYVDDDLPRLVDGLRVLYLFFHGLVADFFIVEVEIVEVADYQAYQETTDH